MAKKKVQEAPAIIEDIRPSTLDELMGDRFDIYAKDVIQDRAIPDARDGLKPVQRRIIYAMYKTGNTSNKPTKKCAHIVGEVMGKYHPHGDSSIYEALVRMSQTWRIRLPLIDFQGNNGSMDGDGPAAYRYTEARLASLAQELTRDIDKDTVDMGLTFDDTEWEPTVLPAHFPNLLLNGTSGIAVGMATEIPPHNLKELTSAIIYRIQHPNCPIETLMRLVPGPDFPTGGIIYQSQGLSDIYLSGRGRIDISSKTQIVEEDGRSQIIVTEIPYGVNKSSLVGSIDKFRHDKTIPGIEEVRDETDKSGLRIAIDIKAGFKPEAILNFLLSKTQLKTSYSANMVAIVEGRPQTMNLLSYCDTYIDHQVEVTTRRAKFELSKSEARLSIVEGLIRASDMIDEIIHVIRASEDKADSMVNLQNRFGFTPDQSEAIVMMPLHKLSHFDVNVILDERKALTDQVRELRSILSSKEKLDQVIIDDLRSISKTYGDERRTVIEEEASKLTINARDLIAKETVMVSVSRDGYVKRSSLASWKGSGGQNGAYPGLKEGDTLVFCQQVETTDFLVMFTSKGNYLYCPVHLLKINKWLEEGQHVNYAISITPDEKIVCAFVLSKFPSSMAFALVSRKGQIKRVRLSNFPVTRFTRPIRAMKLLGEDDALVGAALTRGDSTLAVFSENGLASVYPETLVPISGTTASGVKAASFKGSPVAGILAFDPNEDKKFVMITDLIHTRVVNLNNLVVGERLSKANVVFRCFKSELHKLVFVDKVGDKEAPFTYIGVTDEGKNEEIVFEDFYLTPSERYAKKLEGFGRGRSIKTVHIKGGTVVGPDEQGVIPEEAVPEVVASAEENNESSSSFQTVEGQEEQVIEERFEQISIFGDDF